jgi:hypothetical protein
MKVISFIMVLSKNKGSKLRRQSILATMKSSFKAVIR